MPTPADLGGRVLATAVTALAHARGGAKPMHPRGVVLTGHLERYGVRAGAPRTGAAFLDDAGADLALVRLSRSAGLPDGWPDVNGLAVRVPTSDDEPGDVLLSGTGRSRVGRYLLAAHRRAGVGFLGTLVPYRTPSGPVHLGAEPVDGHRFRLLWARPSGSWHPFAQLRLDRPVTAGGEDDDVAFDAIRHVPDGLENYDWYARLRGPSYAAARRVRGAVLSPEERLRPPAGNASTGRARSRR